MMMKPAANGNAGPQTLPPAPMAHPPASMNHEQTLRAQAIIQSLEQMHTDARTRELHKDAAIAVLRDQLQKSQLEIIALKKQIEDAKPKKPTEDTEVEVASDTATANGAANQGGKPVGVVTG